MAEAPLHRKKQDRLHWRFTNASLLDLASRVPDTGELPPIREWLLAEAFLGLVFGSEWIGRHVQPDGSKNFIRADMKTFEGRQFYFQRVIDLAEMVFNLQGTEGFDVCLDQLAGGKLESGFAELEAAKLLRRFRVRFRFHIPEGRRRKDYDLDVVFRNGELGCAETKCRVEGSKFSPRQLLQRLKEYRKQLDPSIPGAILLRAPPSWLSDLDSLESLRTTFGDFLSGTRSVVSAVVWSTPIVPTTNGPKDGLSVYQFVNPQTRFRTFQPRTDWRLLPLGPVPPRMPTEWVEFWNIYRPLKRRVVRKVEKIVHSVGKT